jgi:hypothetical protein
MITINYNLFLLLLFVYFIFVSVCYIIVGLSQTKKSQAYGTGDACVGIGFLLVLLCCIVF